MVVDGTDSEKGPYCVTIPKGTISADYCINITNDEVLESDETFIIHINKTALHPDVVLVEPDEATVTIMDDEFKQNKNGTYKYCIITFLHPHELISLSMMVGYGGNMYIFHSRLFLQLKLKLPPYATPTFVTENHHHRKL